MIQAYNEKMLTLIKDAVLLEGNFVVGSSGAVGTLKGGGIESVEKLGTGIYRINLDRTYNRLLSAWGGVIPPTTGSAIAAGSLVASTCYRITTLGTSDFTLVGAAKNQVGDAFVASGTTTGTGTATEVAPSQMVSLQVISTIPDSCSHLVAQIVDDGGNVIQAEEGSVISFCLLLRKSSVKGQGE